MKSRLVHRLIFFFNSISLRKKLLSAYFLLIFVPLVLFTLYAYHKITDLIQNETFIAAEKTFDESYEQVNAITFNASQVIETLTYDPLMYQMISAPPSDYALVDQMKDTDQLEETFEHMRVMSKVEQIVLYTGNDYLYSLQNRDIFSLSDQPDHSWPKQMVASGESQQWFSQATTDQEARVFSLMRTIYSPLDISKPLGILRVDIQRDAFKDILDNARITPNSINLLFSQDDVLVGDGASQALDTTSLLPLSTGQEGSWIETQINKKKYYLIYRNLEETQWLLTTLIPVDDILQTSNQLRAEMLLAVILLTLISYGIAYLVTQSTLIRLSHLHQAIGEVEKGNLTPHMIHDGTDEIGDLKLGFSMMLERLDHLLKEKEAYGRERKNLELKALHAQINPHFLYNSLDLINCSAIENNVPSISKLVNALAKYYKLALNRGKEVITLKEEIEHTKLYIFIQNMRFDQRIHVKWTIEDHLCDCSVIKTILQPIVENAIIHGLFEKPNKSGCLNISVEERDDIISIRVHDDGVGMSQETIAQNFVTHTPLGNSQILKPSKGYGVRNIHERLHLAYGPEYGLDCISTVGNGTTVTIRFPYIHPSQA